MSDFIKAGKTGINPKTGLQYTTKEIDDQLFQAPGRQTHYLEARTQRLLAYLLHRDR